MSRIGKLPIEIPSGVEVSVEDGIVRARGPKGELAQRIPNGVRVRLEEEARRLLVERESDGKQHRQLHGLTRTLVANMVTGVSQGFEKTLEITGVGYRALKKGENVELQIGYARPLTFSKRPGIEFEVPTPARIIVRGNDKQAVGEVAAEIRAVRPPEPYKGKGIRYAGEYVRRKVGKTAK